jgi:hypothetical protein
MKMPPRSNSQAASLDVALDLAGFADGGFAGPWMLP